jgi:CxxC-x17-CxxC domain-containing protein
MAFEDQVLICADCNQEFIFTVGEQEFYADKGLVNSPKRCKGCRSNRKAQQRGGGGSRGGGKQLFSTVCSNCGYPTKVPFKPTGDRPVYCKSCMR